MSLKFGRLACPKRTETVTRLDWDVSILTLEGGIPQWAGGGGEVHADFALNPGPFPHSAFGPIKLRDGVGNIILDVPNALIQVEQGPNDGVWKTWANFAANGLDTTGHPYAFRLAPDNPADPTSINVDFALSSETGVAAEQAVKVWQGTVMPVAEGDFDPLLRAWIEAQGVNVSGLTEFIRSLGNKVHAQNAAEKVVAWIQANVPAMLDPQKVLAIALAAIVEVRGGAPGFNPQHGGLA